jgi:hypothetical protein
VGFAEALAAATKQAVCGWLANGGNAALSVAVINGVRTPGAQVPAMAAGLGLMALNYGCNFDPDGGKLPPGTPIGCSKTSVGGYLNIERWLRGAFVGNYVSDVREITATRTITSGTGASGPFVRVQYDYIDRYGVTKTSGNFDISTDIEEARSVLKSGTCLASNSQPNGTLAPVTYTDTTTNCNYYVEFDSWLQLDSSNFAPVVKIGPSAQARASGGIIGGCNFNKIIYVGPPQGPGGPGGGGPWWWDDTGEPDGPDNKPWWWEIAQGAITQLIVSAIRDLLLNNKGATADEIMTRLTGSASGAFPGTTYALNEPCDGADGSPARTKEIPISPAPALTALMARVDTSQIFQQYLKDYRQPVCRSLPFVRQGEPVTVRFQSDEPSPNSGIRLDKRLVYLDQSASPLEAHSLHWADFSWQAGSVIVGHKGASWGVPKVWAASIDEGKRVLRHAGQIAGVDPDQEGEWYVTGTGDQRYGQTGTMRVRRRSGALCVSKRPDPAGKPLLMVEP